jgi:hypothetical protein
MKTTNLTLTAEWVKISDGINTTDFRVDGGTALIAFSMDQPEADSGYHSMTMGEWMNIYAPLVGWAKTNLAGSSISMTVYSSE